MVYVVPPINSGKPWVLYNPDLVDRSWNTLPPIMAKMLMLHCPNRTFLATKAMWTAGGGSVLRNCKAVNPKGFTACLNCRVLFTFEPIAEVSKDWRKGRKRWFFPSEL